MGVSWQERVFGFAGLGGLRWVARTLGCPGDQPEDLAPEDVDPPGGKAVEVEGERVVYTDDGAGDPPLLLIHGIGESTRCWDQVRPALAANHRVVAMDLWGFGASARPAGMRPARWVAQVRGLLDHLGIERVVLVGHSLGGCVSLMCASDLPERVRAVALCNADWGQAPLGYVLVRLISYSAFMPLVMAGMRGSLEPFRDLLGNVAGPTMPLGDEHLEVFRSYLRVRGTRRTWASLARTHRWSDVHRLPPTLQCPGLVVWGEDDLLIPLGWGQALAEALPEGQLVTIPGCGHCPQEEYPEQVVAALQGFLEGL